MEQFYIEQGTGSRDRVILEGKLYGEDLNVMISGGTAPHLGAVAFAFPVSQYHGRPAESATVNLISRYGHRDDKVALLAAKILASKLNRTVLAAAGIHIDEASKEEIDHLVCLVEAACQELIRQIGERKEQKNESK